jgi:hypothetical protein
MKNCDMCGFHIVDKKCDCGMWQDEEEAKNFPLHKAIEHFHNMRLFTLSGDAPHLGCAIILFRGDYGDCKQIKKFIYQMKGRPYYEQDDE